MRLTDLDPRWVGIHNMDPGAVYHIGVSFNSPLKTEQRLVVLFRPAIDPAGLAAKYQWPEPYPEKRKWARTGDMFETLTLEPSCDFSESGEWHGRITNGEVT